MTLKETFSALPLQPRYRLCHGTINQPDGPEKRKQLTPRKRERERDDSSTRYKRERDSIGKSELRACFLTICCCGLCASLLLEFNYFYSTASIRGLASDIYLYYT